MFLLPLLLRVRGPVISLTILGAGLGVAYGPFFMYLHQGVSECVDPDAPRLSCAVDVLAVLVSGLIIVGSVVGAATIGLSPTTPRSNPIFRVDGLDVAPVHTYGLNRTEDNPAIVEWQHNATSRIYTYTTYSKGGQLFMRHHTGIYVTDPDSIGLFKKRSTCEAYYDFVTYGDEFRGSYLKYPLTQSDAHDIANAMFNYMLDKKAKDTCMFFQGDDTTLQARFRFGASCSHTSPAVIDCADQDYNTLVYHLANA